MENRSYELIRLILEARFRSYSLFKPNLGGSLLFDKLAGLDISQHHHCVKSVQVRNFVWSVFSPSERIYGTEKTPCLDTSHVVHYILLNRVITSTL